MKLITAAIGLVASEFALAQQKYETYIHFDCYKESDKIYGDITQQKVSDLQTMTGLDAYRHRMIAITGCVDQKTTLISGLTTVWGKWDGVGWTYMQRLNVVGRLAGLYEFDDNGALGEAGLPTLKEGQELALQRYWYQEASGDQEQLYLIRKSVGEMDT